MTAKKLYELIKEEISESIKHNHDNDEIVHELESLLSTITYYYKTH